MLERFEARFETTGESRKQRKTGKMVDAFVLDTDDFRNTEELVIVYELFERNAILFRKFRTPTGRIHARAETTQTFEAAYMIYLPRESPVARRRKRLDNLRCATGSC